MKLLLFTLSLLTGWGVHAEQVYLLFSDECGQQIRYRRSVEQQSAPDYYAYVFTDGRSRYILETDSEGSSNRSDLPDSYLSCTTAVLSDALIDRINAGTDQLTVLIAENGGATYQVQPVVMAAVVTQDGEDVSYHSPMADFAFNLSATVIGENLDRGTEGARVYFEGRQGGDCSGDYLFVQQNSNSAYPTIRYKFTPRLGITERVLEGNGTYTTSERISALEVNNLPLSTYIADVCARDEAPTPPPVTTYTPYYVEADQAPEIPQIANSAPETATYQPAPVAAAPASPPPMTDVVHTVVAGETLYRVSVRYGVDVNTIKSLNDLSSNTIYVGQQLVVSRSDEGYIAQQTPEVAPATPPVADRYETPGAPVSVPTVVNLPASPVSGDYHVVQPGETIASLALRFGYTESRFRTFNGIEGQQVALVGQQLRTSHCSCPHTVSASPAQFVQQQAPATANPYSPPPAPAPRPDVIQIVVPPARPLAGVGQDTTAPNTPLPPAYGGGRTTHVVREGESLYAIARQYGVGVSDLQRLNALGSSAVIVPHQKLYVN
ncbi:hypothetical protein LEM8419_01312 [Neolewinella maritima]|uniref:LysM domain-containing protein n=1 Tax=Neolewinella maritima TaxID=1383882 RepID=A0ABN8F6B9_9BACT|nr:LysM peptidoglycan-binding domain-containing protein [Neolewinella maritima]CAH1000165.1 hypothetical protein LEM8419_01312 [Neolewinella maritima]